MRTPRSLAAPAEPVPRLGHRPALDGLRGVAVILVVIHHLRPSVLPGGFLGVDLFFVLSGFLITTLLVEEWQRIGSVRLPRFYLRRALRLLPALAVLLLFLGVLGVFAHSSGVQTTRGGLRPVAFYVANWAVARGYNLGGLQHMWSLAVEEQFYLVWPVVLVALLGRRDGRRHALVFALAVAAAVIVARTVAVGAGVPRVRLYAGFDTRADGVLLGCALALARSLGLVPRRMVGPGLALAGVAALGWMAVWWRPVFLYWDFATAGLAAVVLLAHVVAHPGGALGRALGARPLRWAGRLSYSLYLWHWPIIYLMRVQLHPARIPLALALSLAAAVLSARLVERPFLQLKRRTATAGAATPALAPGVA